MLHKRTVDGTVTTVIPNHKELAPGTLRTILKQTGVSVENFLKLLSLLVGMMPRFW